MSGHASEFIEKDENKQRWVERTISLSEQDGTHLFRLMLDVDAAHDGVKPHVGYEVWTKGSEKITGHCYLPMQIRVCGRTFTNQFAMNPVKAKVSAGMSEDLYQVGDKLVTIVDSEMVERKVRFVETELRRARNAGTCVQVKCVEKYKGCNTRKIYCSIASNVLAGKAIIPVNIQWSHFTSAYKF